MTDKTKAVIFDMMGVLIKEAHVIRDLLAPLVKSYLETARAAYKEYEFGIIDKAQFWSKLDSRSPDAIEKLFLNQLRLNDNVHEILSLFKRKYKLAVLSGLPTDWIERIVKEKNIRQYFDVIDYSGKSKLSKKQPEAFERLLNLLKKEPLEVYHIDDRPIYIETANKVGINTIWYDNGLWPCEVCTPKYKIHSLLDLKKIL